MLYLPVRLVQGLKNGRNRFMAARTDHNPVQPATKAGLRPAGKSLPVGYMQRTRDYYAALGYETPYRWAQFDTVPFQELRKPLSRANVALITTAARFDPALGEQGPGAPYNSSAKFYQPYAAPADGEPDVCISHIAYDRAHTSGEDPGCWFPLKQLKSAVKAGRIGAVTPNFFGLPTNRSHKVTLQTDCPDLLRLVSEDGADAAVIVPNCPVCHQSASFAARYLEANGIATVIMGCAKDIVEHAGVPRFLFSDFPLGNGAGRPHDPSSQSETLSLALGLLERADSPRTTWQSPLIWSVDESWKRDYCSIDRLTGDELNRLRAEFDEHKTAAKDKMMDS